jgi:chromosome segregation ATPase
MKKIEESELKKIAEIKDTINSLVSEIGNLEFNRINLDLQYVKVKSRISSVKEEEELLLEKLSKKYGDVMINPETGEITDPNK